MLRINDFMIEVLQEHLDLFRQRNYSRSNLEKTLISLEKSDLPDFFRESLTKQLNILYDKYESRYSNK